MMHSLMSGLERVSFQETLIIKELKIFQILFRLPAYISDFEICLLQTVMTCIEKRMLKHYHISPHQNITYGEGSLENLHYDTIEICPCRDAEIKPKLQIVLNFFTV